MGGWLTEPAHTGPSARLVVVMHGVRRNAREYVESWRAWSQQAGRPVLAPLFDARHWPGARAYNLGRVLDPEGWPVPYRERGFTALRRLVVEAQVAAGLTDPTWDLFGHSAGAQFAHRFALLGEDATGTRALGAGAPEALVEDLGKGIPVLGRVVVAGAGWFTVPDPGIDWPYGTRHPELGVDELTLTRWTRRPITFLRGEHDRDRDEHLRVDPGADAQGRTRWERAAHMLAAGGRWDADCRWELVDVLGVGHHEHEMAPIVQARWSLSGDSTRSCQKGGGSPAAEVGDADVTSAGSAFAPGGVPTKPVMW